MTQLATILATAQAALADVTDMVGLEQVKARYLGKSGELTELLKQLGKLPPEERKPPAPPSTKPSRRLKPPSTPAATRWPPKTGRPTGR